MVSDSRWLGGDSVCLVYLGMSLLLSRRRSLYSFNRIVLISRLFFFLPLLPVRRLLTALLCSASSGRHANSGCFQLERTISNSAERRGRKQRKQAIDSVFEEGSWVICVVSYSVAAKAAVPVCGLYVIGTGIPLKYIQYRSVMMSGLEMTEVYLVGQATSIGEESGKER